MTNYEMIKQFSVEEMAEFFNDLDNCDTCMYDRIPCKELSCKDGIKEWLESEAEDNGTV